MLGITALLRMVAGPGWGWAADRLGRPRPVLAAAAAGAALGSALLPATSGFASVLAAVALQGVAAAALSPLTDALSLSLAKRGRLDYGRTRAWGSASFMAATAAGGLLLQATGTAAVPGVLLAGYGLAAGLAVLLPTADRPPPVAPGGWGIVELLRIPAFRLTLLATALIQGAHAAYYSFAPLYWRAHGISDAVIGLLVAESIVAEIALFVWGRGLVERLGPARLTAAAAGFSVLRWSVTAATTDLAALAAVQVLHAGTFALQHLATMLVLRALPGARAGLAQTVMAAVGFSAATGLLTWVSGALYARIGGGTFLVMAAVGGSALLLVPALRR